MIGSMNDEILQTEELALELIRFLQQHYAGLLEKRYGLDEAMAGGGFDGVRKGEEDEIGKRTALEEWQKDALGMLNRIGESRHCYSKGEELDLERAAGIVVDDFRSGKLGRITLEFPV